MRAKSKIRTAGIPYVVPGTDDLEARLDAVLTVIYLVFNEGYAATRGGPLVPTDLCAEAIRLCAPGAFVMGAQTLGKSDGTAGAYAAARRAAVCTVNRRLNCSGR